MKIEREANHFMALRSAWTKISTRNTDPDEHIDSLNKIVGMIKNNVNSLIKQ